MVDGVEKGASGNIFNWKGNMDVDGTLNVDGNVTLGGSLTVTGGTTGGFRVKEISFAAWGTYTGATVDSGFSLPAGSYLTNIFLNIGTGEAAKAISVGTSDTANELVSAVTVATAGIYTDTVTFIKPVYCSAITPIKYKATTGTSAIVGKIVLVYAV